MGLSILHVFANACSIFLGHAKIRFSGWNWKWNIPFMGIVSVKEISFMTISDPLPYLHFWFSNFFQHHIDVVTKQLNWKYGEFPTDRD